MKKIIQLIMLFAVSFYITADQKGEQIAKSNFDLKKSKDSYSIATMVIISKSGDKKNRKLEMFTKETSEGTNSFIRFLEPADVKGSTFLTIAYKKGDDDQRLYLPALGKIRKIASNNKDGRFMGSDLFYYDMEDRNFEDFQYKFIKDDKYNNQDFSVVEYISNDKNCPYSKELVWISKTDYFIYKIECYDKKDETRLCKTIVMLDVKSFDGVLIPGRFVVDNNKEGTKTLLQRENIKINTGLKDSIFTVQNMSN